VRWEALALSVCVFVLASASAAGATPLGCPSKPSGLGWSSSPSAQQELVPPGAVSLTLCRYRGLNDPSPRYVNELAGSGTVSDQPHVQAFAAQFDALPPLGPIVPWPMACPSGDESSVLAVFNYAQGPPDPVFASLTGCATATNGHVVRSLAFAPGQRLRSRLARITGCHTALCDSDPVVPRVVGRDVATAYRRLHRAGLRVSLPAFELDLGLGSPLRVTGQSIRAGTGVADGGSVTLTLGCPGCGVGSPAVPTHLPRYVVPDLVGGSVAAAARWVAHKELYFVAHLGALKAGAAPDLLGNYRVTRQRPRAGKRLQLGTATSCCGGAGGSFLPTPLTVWGQPTP
jgi:hypothetical protein